MLAAWLAWIGAALATPVELPVGEEAGVWRTALTLSGLERGVVGSGPGVKLTVRAESLIVWVRDVQGSEHQLVVPLPDTPRARESVTALAASLVHPMDALALPEVELPEVALPEVALPGVASAKPPAPRRPRPEAVPVAAPVPEASLPPSLVVPALVAGPFVRFDPLKGAVPVQALAMDAETLLPSLLREPPESWLARGFLAMGPSLRMRPSLRSTAGLGGMVGLRARWLSVALGVEGAMPALLLRVDGERRLAMLDVHLFPALHAQQWSLGPAMGLSGRLFFDEGQPPAGALLPTAGLALSRTLPVRDLAMRFSLLVERDLVPSEVGNEEEGWVRLQPVSVGLGTTLLIGHPTRD